MAWIDDRIWCHPKFVALSPRAFRAWVQGVAYSSGFGTRGRLSAVQLKLVGATEPVRRELIDAGLWENTADGVVIHDWDEHNGKRDERRAKDRERKRAARASAGTSADKRAEKRASRRTLTGEGSEGSDLKLKTIAAKNAATDNQKRKPRARKPDPLWDTLVDLLGAEAAGLERGRWNKACQSLRASGATPDTLRAAAATYRTHPTFANCAMTATALAANWTTLTATQKTSDELAREDAGRRYQIPVAGRPS